MPQTLTPELLIDSLGFPLANPEPTKWSIWSDKKYCWVASLVADYDSYIKGIVPRSMQTNDSPPLWNQCFLICVTIYPEEHFHHVWCRAARFWGTDYRAVKVQSKPF